MDARVGGTFRMSFTHFGTGTCESFGGEFLELEPNVRIRHSDAFDDPGRPGIMETTVELSPVSCGTDLRIVQEGLPEAVPLEMCHLGWQESLAQLRLLVEAQIPG